MAIYHRLHRLWPFLARPAVGRGLRLLFWGVFSLWLAFVVLVLALRYVVLPKIGDYRTEIEQAASRAVGQPIRIGRVEARWHGVSPDLLLEDVVFADRQGMPAFSLSRVEGVLSWTSLLHMRPMLALLSIEQPRLQVCRDANGKISIAGIDAEGESDPALREWVLGQRQIRIHDAVIVWDDALRKAPPLILNELQFALDNRGRRHHFGLSAAPPADLAARIDLRGEVKGDLGDALEHLSAKVFIELSYADLAGWQAWVDYPVQLPQGRGAMRIWGDLNDGSGKVTADVALEDLRVRLSRKLPELDLASLRGRLVGKYRANEWGLSGYKLELSTQDGLRVAPTDFQLEWRQNPQTNEISGNASASFLDLALLSRLAGYMPLDARSRELLQKHAPAGRISELRTGWTYDGERLRHYSLKAAFGDLGLAAGGYFPGGDGLSGLIDFTEKGGSLTIDSVKSTLSLPAVFPVPEIAFDTLKANASWKNGPEGVDIKLEKVAFSGPDAAGGAQGTYRYTGEGPGEIDLTAQVDRADGRAVWRYMPHAVNGEARQWLRRGIVGGRGYDGRLVLKGNLKDFPFRDGKGGKFIVTAKAAGAQLT